MTKTCPTCRTPFTSPHSHQRFCTAACRHESRLKMWREMSKTPAKRAAVTAYRRTEAGKAARLAWYAKRSTDPAFMDRKRRQSRETDRRANARAFAAGLGVVAGNLEARA